MSDQWLVLAKTPNITVQDYAEKMGRSLVTSALLLYTEYRSSTVTHTVSALFSIRGKMIPIYQIFLFDPNAEGGQEEY